MSSSEALCLRLPPSAVLVRSKVPRCTILVDTTSSSCLSSHPSFRHRCLKPPTNSRMDSGVSFENPRTAALVLTVGLTVGSAEVAGSTRVPDPLDTGSGKATAPAEPVEAVEPIKPSEGF